MDQENNFETQGNNGVPNNQPLENNVDVQITKNDEINNKSPKTSKILLIIGLIITIILIIGIVILNINNDKESSSGVNSEIKKSAYWISSNALEPFDLYFLQLENGKENRIYSPLSIKYALEMLEEGTVGDAKAQISSVIGNYEAKKYINSRYKNSNKEWQNYRILL